MIFNNIFKDDDDILQTECMMMFKKTFEEKKYSHDAKTWSLQSYS